MPRMSCHRDASRQPLRSLLDRARAAAEADERCNADGRIVKRPSDDLETRIANRKRELITEIVEHKKNSSRYGAAEAIDKITQHLSELSQIMSANQSSPRSEGTRLRLVEWMAR